MGSRDRKSPLYTPKY